VKVGELVQYYIAHECHCPVGIIVEIDPCDDDPDCPASLVPYKVRWSGHTDSERDWYREDELVKL